MPSMQLQRSESDKMLAGVCGGIAEYLGVDAVFVRLAAVLLAFASGVGLFLYPVLWLVLPTKTNTHLPFADRVMDNLSQVGDTVMSSVERWRARPNSAGIAAAVLIVLGLCFLANNLGFLAWIGLGGLGAIVLIAVGLYLLFGRNQ